MPKFAYITVERQLGAVLVTGLIFLVVLTLISIAAMRGTLLEERMAGNARDQDLAFQAAEAAMRDAMGLLPGLSPASYFVAGCAAGLCLSNPVMPVWDTVALANNQWDPLKTAAYGGTPLNFDGATQLPVQPRFIIELLPAVAPPGSSASTGKGLTSGAQLIPYRITARGWGINGQTFATVQSAIIY